jgi:GT2 family glycosyltransferase
MGGQIYGAVRRIGGSVRRLVRPVRRRIKERARQRSLRATPKAEQALVEELLGSLPGTAVDHGLLVSIIILNRNGREHLERCLAEVASTAYRDVEIIVVDNGSTDGSPDLAESFELPFPIRVIRNEENRSFSEANAQGVAVAAGELICFLNNDVDPITDDWLGYMVETMVARQAVAVGARLIYPRHRGGVRAGVDIPDLSLQHGGVGFDRTKPVPLGRVIGAGDDAVSPWAAQVEDRPALTAACLLVRANAFHAVGGFSPEYFYGIEDVDLCLKLRAAGGRLVYDGRAALWHHESATRVVDRARFSARSSANREAFIGLWGPRIFRDALLDALLGGERVSSDPFHVAITVPDPASAAGPEDWAPGQELGSTLEENGWRVSYLAGMGDRWSAPDKSVEAVIVVDATYDVARLARNVVTIAWIRDEAEQWLDKAWFDDCDLVFASTEGIVEMVREASANVARLMRVATPHTEGQDAPLQTVAAIREALIEWAAATRYGLRIGEGGYPAARDLQRSLRRAGHPTRVHLLPEWASPTAARDDVAVHLLGPEEAPTRPGQVNILWQIGHPDLATRELYERYDHVFVAPDLFAVELAERVSVPVTPLPQATDQRAQALCDVAEALASARPAGIDDIEVAS